MVIFDISLDRRYPKRKDKRVGFFFLLKNYDVLLS